MMSVSELMSETYPISERITLITYVFRYMAQINKNGYVLHSKDMGGVLQAFTKMLDLYVNHQITQFFDQLDKVTFERRKDRFFVTIQTKNQNGMKSDINKKIDDRKSDLNEIYYILIENESILEFVDVDTPEKRSKLQKSIKSKGTLFDIPTDKLTKVHPDILKAIDTYLNADFPVTPIEITCNGISAHVNTNSMYKDISFHLKKGVILPGIRNHKDPLPSCIIEAVAGSMNLKMSLDR